MPNLRQLTLPAMSAANDPATIRVTPPSRAFC